MKPVKDFIIVLIQFTETDYSQTLDLLDSLCISIIRIGDLFVVKSEYDFVYIDQELKETDGFSPIYSYLLTESSDKKFNLCLSETYIDFEMIKANENEEKKVQKTKEEEKYESKELKFELDKILDKIFSSGIESLSFEEKQFLDNNNKR